MDTHTNTLNYAPLCPIMPDYAPLCPIMPHYALLCPIMSIMPHYAPLCPLCPIMPYTRIIAAHSVQFVRSTNSISGKSVGTQNI
ncbi:unnamed protein product [Adineta ricciae]|uniref:Uncharacterized protein n=1 Tax=Adineta ricciae TaxID=249248 RepID=A0A814MXQ0_ADIRI|nr:unnamed protein product [Adineta ricciae]